MPNLYETLLIVTPDADDERVDAVIGDLRVVVENDGGTVLQAGVWERRKLAYAVQGKTEGIYVLMYADGDNTLPAALKYRMKLDESVIRSMVIRVEDRQEADVREQIAAGDHAADAEQIAAQKAAAERRHEAEAAAAALSLEEQVAIEQAGVAAEEVAAAIVEEGEGEVDVEAVIAEVAEVAEDDEAAGETGEAAEVAPADETDEVDETDEADEADEAAGEDTSGDDDEKEN
ncbi:MAG: 30S ribosomal protein S6 [Acidobacteriota bacterium]|jgi:small subunit ribosomal protein S6